MKQIKLSPLERSSIKKHLTHPITNLQLIKSVIERDFQNAIKNRKLGNEKDLREELANFLRIVFPENVKVEKEVKTKFGIIDILIDRKYILELKYADNRESLDRGIAQVIKYNKLCKPVIVVILDIGILSSQTISQYCSYYRENGAETVVIKANGRRERVDNVTSLLKDLLKCKKFITIQEIMKDHQEKKGCLITALYRLEKRGWIERIEKGKYMIIPPGAEKGRYTLHEFVIASMLINPYAIAYWSALNYFGLTEQIPTTVFIQTTARKKRQNLNIFGVDYRIVRIVEKKFFGLKKEWIDESEVNITDIEKTIVDCLDKPQYCGGIIEVAKALKRGKYNAEKLSEYAKRIGNSGVIRRLGYLSETLGINVQLPEIKTRNYLYLDPTMPKQGKKNAKWKLVINLDEKAMGEIE